MSSAIAKSVAVVCEPVESELETLFEISDDGFVLYEPSGSIRLASKRLRRLLDLSESEWLGLQDFPSLSRLISRRLAPGRPALLPPWLLWQPDHGAGCEQLPLAAGGRMLERVVRPMAGDRAGANGWVERYRDFAFDRELPARLFQTDKLAALGQMVAGIAHELNNPLTSVMGYGRLLLDRPLDGRALADAHRLCQEAERAARVVRSLLMLAREAKLDRSPICLNEIIERTLRLCAYDLQRASIAVEVDLAPNLPRALANPIQFQQVVLNLLMNSQQAIAATGRPGRVVIRTRSGPGRVCLVVQDDGPGIPLELQSRIFEPFFTTKPVGVGTGLGLSIITSILRQHAGEIQVVSKPGSGAIFTVSLPEAQAQPQPAACHAAEIHLPVSGSRILVAEPEPVVGRLIVDTLTAEGHQVELVSDGEEVLCRVRQTVYDLVICDWRMPRLDAAQLCRTLGGFDAARRERLLLITSDPAACNASRYLHESKFRCLTKPFLISELKGAIARLIGCRNQPLDPTELRSIPPPC